MMTASDKIWFWLIDLYIKQEQTTSSSFLSFIFSNSIGSQSEGRAYLGSMDSVLCHSGEIALIYKFVYFYFLLN